MKLAKIKKNMSPETPNPRRLIYIASTSYTGSTLLAILLGSHPSITTVSELTGLNPGLSCQTYLCSCQKTMETCEFWLSVRDIYYKKYGENINLNDLETRFYLGDSILLRNILYRSLYSNILETTRNIILKFYYERDQNIQKWINRNERLIEVMCELTDADTFVDASKDPSRLLYLGRMKGVSLSVIHLVRDVRGFVNSCRKNNNDDIGRSSRRWARIHGDIERLAQFTHADYRLVRYEDLCENTDSLLGSLYHWLGVDDSVSWKFNPRDQHILGNRMRLRENLTIRFDDSWRNELRESDIQKSLKGKRRIMMKRYGYQV